MNSNVLFLHKSSAKNKKDLNKHNKTLDMKTKIFFSIFFLALVSGICPATSVVMQDEPQRLVVWFTNGTKITHDLSDRPETSFVNGVLYLNTAKVSVSYPLEQVARYTYEGVNTAINVPTVRPGEVRFSQGDDFLRFDGLATGTKLEVYVADGKLVSTITVQEGAPALISLKNEAPGTYVVKCGDASYKFVKK